MSTFIYYCFITHLDLYIDVIKSNGIFCMRLCKSILYSKIGHQFHLAHTNSDILVLIA